MTNTDGCVLRHRNTQARDFVIVSQAVLFGYPELSDGAKLTFWVIYSHDWYDQGRGSRKGYAFPTIRRLAQLRHTTERTIQRHLTELIGVGLLTRIIRRGKPSLLYIEEPSEEEAKRSQQDQSKEGDIFVGGGVTKMSPQKEEKKKQINSVNGNKNILMEEGSGNVRGWQPIKSLLNPKRFQALNIDRSKWIADQIVAQTGDAHSLGCYRVVAKRCSQNLVFEALALLKEAKRDGSVRQSRGALFIGIVRRLCRERGLLDPLPREASKKPTSPPATVTGKDFLQSTPFMTIGQ